MIAGAKLGVAGIFFLLASCCPTKPPSCPVRADDTDDAPTTRVACQRAADKMNELHCPEARPDYVEWCLHTIQSGIPICPLKMSKVKTCKEIDSICR